MNIQDKKQLRQFFLNLLRKQNQEDRLLKSRQIQKKLFGCKAFQDARVILFYASFDGEVETLQMIQDAIQLQKKIALPFLTKGSKAITPVQIQGSQLLQEGPFGIKQPSAMEPIVDSKDLDLVIVPGLAFDKRHNRLGRGEGFYDRYLASLCEDVPTLGLAFDFQIVDALAHLEAHDMALTDVIVN